MEYSDEVLERLRATVGATTFSDRYVVHREAGEGGMGRVYEATDRGSGRRVAIKVLTHLGTGAERFATEVEILERLTHPAIVAYVGHGVTDLGEPYLAMAWLEGEPLSARLGRGALELADAIAIALRVAEALAYTHRAGVIHRDVKPSNVFLVDGKADQATLLDFGIAKDASGARGLTGTGQLIGTPGYMAPEQAKGDKAIDGRADLFALGCLLYEALAGKPPFSADDAMVVLAQLLLHDPPRIRSLRPEVPVRIDRLVAALLAKDPEQRLADAGEVAAELVQIGEALARADDAALATSRFVVPTSVALAATVDDRPVVARRRRGMVAAAVVGLVAAATVATVVVTQRGGTLVCMPGDKTGCEALCDDGNRKACDSLAADLVGGGSSKGPDIPRGRLLLALACESGNTNTCVTLAMNIRQRIALSLETGSAADWAPWLERGCAQGNSAVPCLMLAQAYEPRVDPESHGLAPDPVRALHFYARVCALKGGCVELSERVRRGAGTAADPARATAILNAACSRGESRACNMVRAVK